MLSIKIPKEINDYQENIIGGMSLRQLASAVISGVIFIFIYPLVCRVIPETVAVYLVFAMIAPFIAVGFIKPKGFKFEEYAQIMLSYHLSPKKRILETEFEFEKVVETKESVVENVPKKIIRTIKSKVWKEKYKSKYSEHSGGRFARDRGSNRIKPKRTRRIIIKD